MSFCHNMFCKVFDTFDILKSYHCQYIDFLSIIRSDVKRVNSTLNVLLKYPGKREHARDKPYKYSAVYQNDEIWGTFVDVGKHALK